MNLNKIYKNYHKHGFVIIKKLLKKSEISEILKELEIIKIKAISTNINQYYHKTADDKINTLHNIQKYHKKGLVINIANNSKIKKILTHLIKDKVKIRNIEFFLKPKKTGMPSPFHQDNFYWNIRKASAANVWIACSESTKNNGGLCYLQESHKLGTINHTVSYMKGSSQKIPDEIMNVLDFKKIFPKLLPGDCLIHHPEVIHGSYKNNSKHDRVGFVLSFSGVKSKIDQYKLLEYKKNLKKNLKSIY